MSTDAIVHAARVSRGALYHRFSDKTDLFAAVLESVEADLMARIAAKAAEGPLSDPVMRMRLAVAQSVKVRIRFAPPNTAANTLPLTYDDSQPRCN